MNQKETMKGFHGEPLISSQPFHSVQEHVFMDIRPDSAGRRVLRILKGNASLGSSPSIFSSLEVDARHVEALRDHLTKLLENK